jgi:ribonuclease Z
LHDYVEKAHERYHSTAHQAALLAKSIGVERLLIGHFSSKYEDVTPLLGEAKATFASTDLALEGVTYIIR